MYKVTAFKPTLPQSVTLGRVSQGAAVGFTEISEGKTMDDVMRGAEGTVEMHCGFLDARGKRLTTEDCNIPGKAVYPIRRVVRDITFSKGLVVRVSVERIL